MSTAALKVEARTTGSIMERVFDDDRPSAIEEIARREGRRVAEIEDELDLDRFLDGEVSLNDFIDHDDAIPLFSLESSTFGRFLDSEPPQRRMLIPDFLPLGVVGVLAASGGAGKSQLLYMLAACVSSGIPFLDMPVGEVGGSLCLFAEDDESELHRRGRRILEHVETIGHVDRVALSARLHVVSRIAENNLLTVGREGEVKRTALVDRVVATAKQVDDLKLIVIDPISRFRGGRANCEEDTTRFVEALEAIRAETGATVLGLVHVTKASLRDASEADQSIVRGSTALVDGVRWCATMQQLRRDAASDYGVEPGQTSRYLRLELPKSNYTRPWPGLWLHREAGGILVPVQMQKRARDRREQRVETLRSDILGRIQELIRTEGAMTANYIRTHHSGRLGTLGAGEKAVRGVIALAIQNGDLLERDKIGSGGGRLLTLPRGQS